MPALVLLHVCPAAHDGTLMLASTEQCPLRANEQDLQELCQPLLQLHVLVPLKPLLPGHLEAGKPHAPLVRGVFGTVQPVFSFRREQRPGVDHVAQPASSRVCQASPMR